MSRNTSVYILTNKNRNVLYVGVTSELEKRIMQHRAKTFGGFTARCNVNCLVYVEEHPSPTDAIAREKQLKGWSRSKKSALISKANPEWKDLSADWWSEAPLLRSGQ